MVDLILIFLGGMLCSASIILVLFQKPKENYIYTIKIVDERKKKNGQRKNEKANGRV